MKSLGKRVIRGAFLSPSTSIAGNKREIQLFDGRFDTAYKVLSFRVFGLDSESHGMLSTGELPAGMRMMNADSNLQIAWCSSVPSGGGQNEIVDKDNLVVQNLYFAGYSTTSSQPLCYLIELEKFDVGLTIGAYSLVRNAEQNLPTD